MNTTAPRTENDALLEFAKDHSQLKEVKLTEAIKNADISAVAVPKGFELKSIKPFADEYRKHPQRRKGHIHTYDHESFSEIINRYKDEKTTMIFAGIDGDEQTYFRAILNYHAGGEESFDDGKAGFGDFDVRYQPKLSKEWESWFDSNNGDLNIMEFAEFLENHIHDIYLPDGSKESDAALLKTGSLIGNGQFASPTKLLQLASGLSIRVDNQVAGFLSLQTGETEIKFKEEHQDDLGGKVSVPSLFAIVIPIFENGDLYSIPVRLRYRIRGGAITWKYIMYQPEKAYEDAVKGIMNFVSAHTGIQVYRGEAA